MAESHSNPASEHAEHLSDSGEVVSQQIDLDPLGTDETVVLDDLAGVAPVPAPTPASDPFDFDETTILDDLAATEPASDPLGSDETTILDDDQEPTRMIGSERTTVMGFDETSVLEDEESYAPFAAADNASSMDYGAPVTRVMPQVASNGAVAPVAGASISDGQKRRAPILQIVVGILVVAAAALAAAYFFLLKPAVPDVVGMTQDEAKGALEQAGFACAADQEYSDTVEAGYVIRQSETAGTHLDRDSLVTIYVSQGASAQVPDVSGMTEQDAISVLEAAGLTSSVTYEAVSLDANMIASFWAGSAKAADFFGVVSSQSVGAGETVDSGTEVQITVTTLETDGLADVLLGLSYPKQLEQAEKLLGELGYTTTTTTEYSDDVNKDTVIGIDVDNDALTISVRVSSGPQFIEVPDVRGMSQTDALNTLGDLGLLGAVRDIGYYSTYDADTVGYQMTDPGTKVEQGETIYLYMSCGMPGLADAAIDVDPQNVTLTEGGSVDVNVRFTGGNQVRTQRSSAISVSITANEDDPLQLTLTISTNDETLPGIIQLRVTDSSAPDTVMCFTNIYYTIE